MFDDIVLICILPFPPGCSPFQLICVYLKNVFKSYTRVFNIKGGKLSTLKLRFLLVTTFEIDEKCKMVFIEYLQFARNSHLGVYTQGKNIY